MRPLVLASGSAARARLLRQANVDFEVEVPRVDEVAVRQSLEHEGATPREIADALAEAKARRVASRRPDALVIASDQVLAFRGRVLGKVETPDEARELLTGMAGEWHRLLTAAVVCEDAEPVWRHVAEVRLHMRQFSEGFLDDYLSRQWETVRDSVGCYHLEDEGVRLFDRIDGDHFAVQGLPLVELLSWLSLRGSVPA